MTAPVSWWNRIKGRVLLWGITISILPLLFLGFGSFNSVHHHMEIMITDTNFERASTIARQTQDYVKDQTDSLYQIASTNSSVLLGNNDLAREIALSTLLREVPYFEEIKVIDSNFKRLSIVARRDVIANSPLSSPETIIIPANKSFSFSPISFSEYGRPQFYLSVRIQDPQNRETIGYLQAKVDLKQIITEFVSVPIGKAGNVYFVDEHGRLFGHTDFSRVLRQEDVRGNQLVQSFLRGEMFAKGIEFKNQDAIEVVGQFVAIDEMNWGVFIEQPASEAFQPIYSFALTLLGVVLGATCIVTLVSIAFGLKLVKPLENLESEVRHIISTGDLKSQIPIQTHDEVGSLVQSFNRLLNSLNTKNINLELEKKLLATVVEGIGAGMVLLDSNNTIVWRNDIFSNWFEGNLNVEHLWELITSFEGSTSPSQEKERVITTTLKGEKRYFRLTQHLLPPENHESAVYLLLIEDVTQRIVMEAKVIETDKMAALGLLASGVAHEINNPLAIIAAYSEDLLECIQDESVPTAKGFKGALTTIIEQVIRCETITGRLLHFARKPSDEPDLFNIGASTLNTLALLSSRARQKKVAIRSNIEPELYVIGNENEWQQVVLNTLSNALDVSKENGVIDVTVSSSNNVLVAVRDYGQGIDPDDLPKVFDPFFTTKPTGQGTGLGLFVSYGIVQRMRGNLMIESVKGEGTLVKITLPSYQAEERRL
jgi:two-component system, NtrC family, sensor kinase